MRISFVYASTASRMLIDFKKSQDVLQKNNYVRRVRSNNMVKV